MRWRRRTTAALAILLLATGCSGDEPAAPAPTSTAMLTTSTTTTAPPTSTSTPPPTPTAPPTVLPCPAGDALRTIDLDGDGRTEGVWLIERPAGLQLVVCDDTAHLTLDLPYAVWYVAATDVEPDGTHELWLGANGWGDAPEQVSTELRRVVKTAEGLEVEFVEGRAGLTIDPSSGAGCVDIDADGVRELVHLRTAADPAGARSDTVAWERWVSNLLPTAVVHRTSGSFDRVTDADAVSLLTTFSCGDDLIPLARVTPPAGICAHDEDWRFTADMDGDGTDDTVVQKRAIGDAFLRGDDHAAIAVTVCLGSGHNDEVPVGGMGEIFDVTVGPGGHPVIWTGGTTLSGAYRSAMVVADGRLVFVEELGGPGWPFGLWDGAELWPDDEPPRFGMSGCADLDGDGAEEFVQIEATVDGLHLAWTRSTWAFDGRFAAAGPTSSGSEPLPPDFEPETDGWSVFNELDLGVDPRQGGCG